MTTNRQFNFFTQQLGSGGVAAVPRMQMDLGGAEARRVAFNIARARGDHAVPVRRASVTAQPQTLGDTEAGRALADHLANAASSFDVRGNRAVQAVDLLGRPIGGYGE